MSVDYEEISQIINPSCSARNMKRPMSITVIGVIFIVAGCLAAIGIVYDLFNERMNFNFAVLMTPVGFGLLKGRLSSRGWAKFWIGLCSLVFGLLLVCYPFFSDSYSVTWFGQQLVGISRHAMAVGFPASFLLIAAWAWRCISSDSASSFFGCHMNNESKRGSHSTLH